jgi:hypothetical protein
VDAERSLRPDNEAAARLLDLNTGLSGFARAADLPRRKAARCVCISKVIFMPPSGLLAAAGELN